MGGEVVQVEGESLDGREQHPSFDDVSVQLLQAADGAPTEGA